MSKRWYALAVKPRKQQIVESQLVAQGYKFVSPRFERIIRHARKTSSSLVPLFPGYTFVQLCDHNQNWRQVNWIQGSNGFVCFNNRPTPLEPTFVKRFLECADAMGVPRFDEKLELGDTVRTVGGIFNHALGEIIEFSSESRVLVMMEALNRKVSISVPKSSLMVA